MLHLDAAVLEAAGAVRTHARTTTDAAGIEGEASLEPGLGVPPETARRLCCDASVVRVVDSVDGTPLDLGRKTRTISGALRRALKSRDRTCRFPGCHHERYLEGHHIEHWADGGATKLENLLHLCWYHHRVVHEGHYRIELDAQGNPRFIRPTGQPLPAVPEPLAEPVSAETLAADHRNLGLNLDEHTLACWHGESMDYDWAVTALLQADRRDRARVTDDEHEQRARDEGNDWAVVAA